MQNLSISKIAVGSLLAITFALLSPQSTYSQAARYAPVAGELHADFSLPSIEDRKAIKLSDFRGKKLLLFHFASW